MTDKTLRKMNELNQELLIRVKNRYEAEESRLIELEKKIESLYGDQKINYSNFRTICLLLLDLDPSRLSFLQKRIKKLKIELKSLRSPKQFKNVEDIRVIPIERVCRGLDMKINKGFALCPLHPEKTPSFKIYSPTNSWYCFGCAQGGDSISLVQKALNLDFIDAVDFLKKL